MIERIEASEIFEHVTRPDKRGKYLAFEGPRGQWWGIDRTGEVNRVERFPTEEEATAFLNAGPEPPPEVPKVMGMAAGASRAVEIQTQALQTAAVVEEATIYLPEPKNAPDDPQASAINHPDSIVEPEWMADAPRSDLRDLDELKRDQAAAANGAGLDQEEKAALLLQYSQNVLRLEGEYFTRHRTHAELEAELKRLLNDFDLANAELIAQKKAATAAKLQAETDLKQALCDWGRLSTDKTFDQYLSVMETVNYEIDEAEATTWAETNYPAALNKTLNVKLIEDYVKNTKKPLPFVKVTKDIAAKISRKV